MTSSRSGLAKITHLSYRAVFIIFLICSAVAVLALRHNNQTMIKLRSEVYAADQSNGNVEVALDKLRTYVYGHMNTDLNSDGNTIKPPIQLKYTYDRLTAEAQAKANNSGLYTEAENYCQAKIPASVSVSGRGRIECVQDYVLNHGGTAAAPIPPALYQFDFISPTWSPDFAGWAVAVSYLAGAAFVFSFSSQVIVPRLKK